MQACTLHTGPSKIVSNLASHPILANFKLTGSTGSPLVSSHDLIVSRCLHADAHQVMSHAAYSLWQEPRNQLKYASVIASVIAVGSLKTVSAWVMTL